jgi:hypothetical protein
MVASKTFFILLVPPFLSARHTGVAGQWTNFPIPLTIKAVRSINHGPLGRHFVFFQELLVVAVSHFSADGRDRIRSYDELGRREQHGVIETASSRDGAI